MHIFVRTLVLPLLVIYLNLCPLFTPRFAHLPEFVNSLEKGLTTTPAEGIFYCGRDYLALPPGVCLVVVSRLSLLITSGAAGGAVGALFPPAAAPARCECVREAHSHLHAHCTFAELPWLTLNAHRLYGTTVLAPGADLARGCATRSL